MIGIYTRVPVVPRVAAAVCRALPNFRGRGALAHRWSQRHRGSRAAWQLLMSEGYRVVAPAGSLQGWTAAFAGRYGEWPVDQIAPYIRAGTSVLDIGASLGLFTVPCARIAQAVGASVIAYEPIPSNGRFVQHNVTLNGLDSVVSLRPVGLGREQAEVEMHVESGGAGNAAVVDGLNASEMNRHDAAGSMGGSVRVPVSTLDIDFPEGCTRVSAIKIDVEGYELDVLEGGERFIAEHRPVMFAEFNPGWLASRGRSIQEAALWAADHEYVVIAFPERRQRPWRARGPGGGLVVTGTWGGGDVLLVPSERHGR